MEVRVATIHDIEDLFLLNELFGNDTTIELIKESILENDREIVCIAFVDGTAAGYCSGLIVKSMCYSEHRADIEALYVKKEYRKKGVGEALILCLESEILSRGIYHFHLNTYSSNTTAQSLYRRIGYSATGEILLEKTVQRTK